VGWINERLDSKNLERSAQILKGERINDLSLKNSQRLNYEFESKIPIYTCSCGDIYCSGIIVDIVVSGNKITGDFNDKVMHDRC